MVNINYRRGRAKEYRIMQKLRDEGFDIVLRSAGSHSSVDIIGIKPGYIKFIQSKPRSMSKNAKLRIEESLDWLNDKFVGICKVI